MNSFEAYSSFVAVKRHFMPGSTYDYHKYNGKTNLKYSSFETRSDRFYYEKLAKKRDVVSFLVANLSTNPKLWIGDLFGDEAESNYARWCRVTESITYTMQTELGSFLSDFDELLKFKDGAHPLMLNAYMSGRVSPEVLSVVDRLVRFTVHWQEYDWDPAVKQAVNRIQKLHGFIEFDPERIKKTLVKIFRKEQQEETGTA